jgi:hypothetical protein
VFGFDYKYTSVQSKRGDFDFSFLSGDYQGPNTFKYEIFPVRKNFLLVRFENIGDNFDALNGQMDQTSKTYYVNVRTFAETIYSYVNGPDA